MNLGDVYVGYVATNGEMITLLGGRYPSKKMISETLECMGGEITIFECEFKLFGFEPVYSTKRGQLNAED